ncbi:MAG: hypothetical protein NTY48_05935 [Candidatus Diapherotrites archaeon]|nr:hypothetical protein [Candidatus Diapherotrites archaeon]
MIVRETKVTWCSCIGTEWRCVQAPEKACQNINTTPNCTGCAIYQDGDKCLPIGTRLFGDAEIFLNPAIDRAPIEKSLFCEIDSVLKEQKKDNEACQNNYECISNSCNSGICANIQQQLNKQTNMIQQIMNWLSSMFGFGKK